MFDIHISNMSTARNRGSEALVAGLLDVVEQTAKRSAIRLSLHTEDPDFDTAAFQGRFDKIFRAYPTLMPFHTHSPVVNKAMYGSLAIAERIYKKARNSDTRLATLSALKSADLIIATGGDVFTSDYRNFHIPAYVFNLGAPVALIAQTLGPFVQQDEDYFRKNAKNIKLTTLRESESYEYIRDRFPELQPTLTADVAFLLPKIAPDRARAILEEIHHFEIGSRRLVGISVSQGVLVYQDRMGRGKYLEEFARFIDWLNEIGVSVVLIPHVQEVVHRNNDMYACLDVFRRLRNPLQNVVLTAPLSASEYKGVIALCEALIGVRTHPTIASLSCGIPTVAIAYSRKAYGIMRDYYGRDLAERLVIDVANLSYERLVDAYQAARTRGPTPEIAELMQQRAALNATEFAKLLPDEIRLEGRTVPKA